MMLLNPGPVNVSERVRQALMKPDLCHRESEFTDLLHVSRPSYSRPSCLERRRITRPS